SSGLAKVTRSSTPSSKDTSGGMTPSWPYAPLTVSLWPRAGDEFQFGDRAHRDKARRGGLVPAEGFGARPPRAAGSAPPPGAGSPAPRATPYRRRDPGVSSQLAGYPRMGPKAAGPGSDEGAGRSSPRPGTRRTASWLRSRRRPSAPGLLAWPGRS